MEISSKAMSPQYLSPRTARNLNVYLQMSMFDVIHLLASTSNISTVIWNFYCIVTISIAFTKLTLILKGKEKGKTNNAGFNNLQILLIYVYALAKIRQVK